VFGVTQHRCTVLYDSATTTFLSFVSNIKKSLLSLLRSPASSGLTGSARLGAPQWVWELLVIYLTTTRQTGDDDDEYNDGDGSSGVRHGKSSASRSVWESHGDAVASHTDVQVELESLSANCVQGFSQIGSFLGAGWNVSSDSTTLRAAVSNTRGTKRKAGDDECVHAIVVLSEAPESDHKPPHVTFVYSVEEHVMSVRARWIATSWANVEATGQAP
jgi:hypothetical protein